MSIRRCPFLSTPLDDPFGVIFCTLLYMHAPYFCFLLTIYDIPNDKLLLLLLRC